MFAKTLLSVLALGVVIVGLLQFFNDGSYLVFVLGMVVYFLATISGSICKRMNK
ncbi:hypothetical protein [Polynucleobacter nymphae]|uniref:hypothetical protein n=1 Tax=Polynucleobacter nymphae TaxID=2081043 RepID=UPI001C0CB07D|nr:hypothetical protein [Polynucleobacter nymphae]MBU3607251.1 hypothetical protein [Polynucleobacter nymphae]